MRSVAGARLNAAAGSGSMQRAVRIATARPCAPSARPPPAQLLLPEDFSLARPAAEAREAGRSGPGPLGLHLTVSPSLLAEINACLAKI